MLDLLAQEQLQTIEDYTAYFCRQNLVNRIAALPNSSLMGLHRYIDLASNPRSFDDYVASRSGNNVPAPATDQFEILQQVLNIQGYSGPQQQIITIPPPPPAPALVPELPPTPLVIEDSDFGATHADPVALSSRQRPEPLTMINNGRWGGNCTCQECLTGEDEDYNDDEEEYQVDNDDDDEDYRDYIAGGRGY